MGKGSSQRYPRHDGPSRVGTMMAEIRAKKHCSCDNGHVHGHCQTDGCNARIKEGEMQCRACQEREERRRDCLECANSFYLPPPKEAMPQHYRKSLCSEKCQANQLDKRVRNSGLPPRYWEMTLENFDPYTPGLEKKLDILRQWVKDDLRTGLYLFGSVGSGKSHLAVGTLRALLQRGVSGRYVNAREFVLRCQFAFSKNEDVRDLVSGLLRRRFLVVDDLGSAKATEYVRQCILHLVDEAYTHKKTLIVTSNLGLNQLDELDPRIASRLAEMCELLQFDVPDYRVRLAEERAERKGSDVV